MRNAGNSTIAILGVLASLGISTAVIQNSLGKMNGSIQQAKQIENSSASRQSNENVMSRFRSLVSERLDDSGLMIPALFAENYFAADWRLLKSPLLEFPNVSIIGKDVVLLQQKSAIEASQISERLKPQSGSPDLLPMNVEISKVKFGSDLRTVKSIDVLVRSGSLGQEAETGIRARIALPTPKPRNPVLEVSPTGENSYTSDLSILDAGGDFDFRIKGSGVVFKALLVVNDAEVYEMGGFDSEGRISHGATNYLSKDEVIGSAITLSIGAASQKIEHCRLVTSLGGTYKFRAVLEGVDGSQDIHKDIFYDLQEKPEKPGKGHSLKLADYAKICVDECPFVEGEGEGAFDAYFLSGGRGDVSAKWSHGQAEEYGVPEKKVCVNFDRAQKADVLFADMVFLDAKTCKREFVFERGACGCLREDSLIAVEDPLLSLKKISELSPADRVWNPLQKRFLNIRKLVRGPEYRPLLRIVTADGARIEATGDHPFLTQDGEKPAADLTLDDSLSKDGEWIRIASVSAVPASGEAPIVWNLELDAPDDDDDSHQLLVNGFVSGDLVRQRRLK